MNTTPKTDECIKMLGEAQIIFSPLYFNSKGYFDKERIIDFQNRIKAMLDYRLLPMGVITIPDNADKETVRANPILQNISNFESFWYAMKNYRLVTADDLKNEFWSICPDLESIPKFLDVMIVKFEDVNCKYDTDINTIKEQYNGLNELVKAEKINEKAADEIFWNIHFIADRYNFIIDCIIDVYRKFRKMAEHQQTKTDNDTAKPQQITIPDNILNELEKEKLIIKEPLQWKASTNLCAYFVDCYFPKTTKNRWVIAENMFNVRNLRQASDLYQNNKTGKPKNHQIIDRILQQST